MMAIDLPTLSVVVSTAIVDSFNPCAIGVLILLISVILATGRRNITRLLVLGGIYTLTVFLVYLAAGLGAIYFMASIPLAVTEYLSLAVGSLVVIAGLLEIKDYFWYGQGPSLQIPHRFSAKLEEAASRATIPGVILLGAFVSAVELPCTGAPYLAIITLLSVNFSPGAFFLLVLYNILFVLPLLIILLLTAGGLHIGRVKQWKQSNKHTMRLGIGVLLITLGWLLILMANGTINLG